MKTGRWGLLSAVIVVALLISAVAGCGTPAPPPAATEAPTTAPTEPTATPAPPEPTPTTGPTVGGTLVITLDEDPESLDPHKTAMASPDWILSWVGGSLAIRDAAGDFVPYLAEGWEISEDGLTWDFTLKEGIKFHDGTPLTAQDYAWTLERSLLEENKTGGTGALLGMISEVEAVDDRTLRITTAAPSYGLLIGLAEPGWGLPMSQAYVEDVLDGDFGKHPMSVGPYIFKEAQVGEKVVLERNPEFNWGPDFGHEGPWYIENVEFRIILDYSTAIAGLEAGEILYSYDSMQDAKDVERLRESGEFQILEGFYQGTIPWGILHVTKPPFDELGVRQAFNLATDKQTLIDVVELGQAVPQAGPLSVSQIGYWPGIEELGYDYDLEQARALMEDAGYSYNDAGMLEKDGEPLRLSLIALVGPRHEKTAQILKEQWKDLGAEVEIQMLEDSAFLGKALEGDFSVGLFAVTYTDVDILWLLFHSTSGFNFSKLNDPKLDELLAPIRGTLDPDERNEAAAELQKYIVDQAYWAFMFNPKSFYPLSNRVRDAVWSPMSSLAYFNDAYIVE